MRRVFFFTRVHGMILWEWLLPSDHTKNVPYNPAEFVEFRFKGRMCSTMGLAEAWLIMVEPGRTQVQVL